MARSSTEAEYKSLAHASADISWVQMLLKDLHVSLISTPTLWCDNISAIALASNPVFHARTKHIEVDYHYVRDKVVNRELLVRHVSTTDQVADIFTKPLSSARFNYLQSKLTVTKLPMSLRGSINSHISSSAIGNAKSNAANSAKELENTKQCNQRL